MVDSAVVKRVYETALREALDEYEAQNLMGEFHDGEWARSYLRIHRTIYEVMAGRRDYPTDDEFRRDGWSQYEIDELGLQEHVELNLEESPADAIVDRHYALGRDARSRL